MTASRKGLTLNSPKNYFFLHFSLPHIPAKSGAPQKKQRTSVVVQRKKSSMTRGVFLSLPKEPVAGLTIETLPVPARIVIPLLQHRGTAAEVVVKSGDSVRIGQIIGESMGSDSARVHATVSGTVTAIGDFPYPSGKHCTAVEIENNGREECVWFEKFPRDWREAAAGEIVRAVAAAGIVGMGGSDQPAHLKLSPPANRPVDTVIINAMECQQYLNADQCLIVNKTDEILLGVMIVKKTVGAQRAVIAVPANSQAVVAAISQKLKGKGYPNVSLVKLTPKYPQGEESILTQAVTGRQVLAGELPVDAGCLVCNVATALAVWDAIINGIPCVQRLVSVGGPTVRAPKNLLVRIGTPLRHLLEYCGTDLQSTEKVIMGGPMRGITQSDLDAPVIKSTTGLVALTAPSPVSERYQCINCGYCVKVCPKLLVPSILMKLIEKAKYTEAKQWDVDECIECGACSYVCPSGINLVQHMKMGKFYCNNPGKRPVEQRR
jgi:electron transport complex protein RnfC